MSAAEFPPSEPSPAALDERGGVLPCLLGGYQLLEAIGEASGQASVYRALQVSCGREVAVKVLAGPIGGDEFVRFQRETRLTAGLEHPNIVRLYDSGRADDGRPLLVMELLRGPTVAALGRCFGRLPVGAACEIVRQAALGLQHAHEKGIVHRDVKPGNLMLDASGTVKVLDFGLARGGTGDPTAGLTCTFTAMGTPHFMAPEQAGSAKAADARADLYGLGCVLFYLLAGQPPFGAASADYFDIITAHRRDPRPDVRDLRPEIDAALATVLIGLLERDRERRAPAVAADLALALSRWAEAPGLSDLVRALPAGPPSLWPSTVRPEAKTSRNEAGDISAGEVINSIGLRLRMVPAGTFVMGSPAYEKGRFDDEGPQHEVAITRPLGMGVWPVTVGHFRAFVTATDYETEAERYGGAERWVDGEWHQAAGCSWLSPGFPRGDEHPVTCVSWNDAVAFTAWLSGLDREREAGRVYRLPGEAEWEYACRAGALIYSPFHVGAVLTAEHAHFGGQARGTVPAGKYAPNGFGLHDMHGNVWEWCHDWYDKGYYRYSPRVDPPGPTGSGRVFRGGGWSHSARRCRSANRNRLPPTARNNALGFRVVAVLSG